MPNWQQLGPVKAKVVGDRTLETEIVSGSGWCVKLHTAIDSTHVVSGKNTEAEAMAAADAIYDLPAKKIEAADRGMNWSFWKSEDGKRVAICYPSMSSKWWMTTTNEDDEDDVNQSQEAAEAAAAKYVGGEG